MADGDPRMDVFGTVEPVVAHHTREQPVVDDSPSASGIQSSTRASKRAQSVDVSARPSRRRRERGDKSRLRAELDAAAPALALGRRFFSLYLFALYFLFIYFHGPAAALIIPCQTNRPANRLGCTGSRTTICSRLKRQITSFPGSTTPQNTSPPALAPNLTGTRPSGIDRTSTARSQITHSTRWPSSPYVRRSHSRAPPAPTYTDPLLRPTPPPILKADRPAYHVLLPNSDPEHTSASPEPKRTSRAAKRSSLTAMLGLGSRKKHKDGSGQDEDSTHLSVRPLNRRIDTQHTMRTFNTVYTTATAGSVDTGDRASLNVPSSPGHSGPSQGARSASGASSHHGFVATPSSTDHHTIEPSAKTLARAAATRTSSLNGMAYYTPALTLKPLALLLLA
ncbi:hypothetical protein RhiXN_11529 [Rhizoctonia solani]|uniref:Uncharacterized protein n=1 Tax=Rhizoctonia solani TaxID=456999 RepID=A0A8H8P6U4_9AGAM|nr:uncharacterized protein RhiXN_11529 [Rhizoctonia solani]QRW24617.1 hypothetical protein RhiXN_11529 [Rhizoctonia solani]